MSRCFKKIPGCGSREPTMATISCMATTAASLFRKGLSSPGCQCPTNHPMNVHALSSLHFLILLARSVKALQAVTSALYP